jgi:NADH:ubiquinone oxidoreductase subunit 2 (subunit N)
VCFLCCLGLALLLDLFWVSLSLVGGIFVRLFCLRQTDLRSLIAYSSVAHMGTVIGGIMTFGYWGVCRTYAFENPGVLATQIEFFSGHQDRPGRPLRGSRDEWDTCTCN